MRRSVRDVDPALAAGTDRAGFADGFDDNFGQETAGGLDIPAFLELDKPAATDDQEIDGRNFVDPVGLDWPALVQDLCEAFATDDQVDIFGNLEEGATTPGIPGRPVQNFHEGAAGKLDGLQGVVEGKDFLDITDADLTPLDGGPDSTPVHQGDLGTGCLTENVGDEISKIGLS